MPQIQQALMDKVMAPVITEEFEAAQWKSTYHESDLRPDVLTKTLNHLLKWDEGSNTLKVNRSFKTDAKASLIKVLSAEASAAGSMSKESVTSWLKKHDLKVEFEGTKIVVKSLQVLRVNLTQFEQKGALTDIATYVVESSAQRQQTMLFGPESRSGIAGQRRTAPEPMKASERTRIQYQLADDTETLTTELSEIDFVQSHAGAFDFATAGLCTDEHVGISPLVASGDACDKAHTPKAYLIGLKRERHDAIHEIELHLKALESGVSTPLPKFSKVSPWTSPELITPIKSSRAWTERGKSDQAHIIPIKYFYEVELWFPLEDITFVEAATVLRTKGGGWHRVHSHLRNTELAIAMKESTQAGGSQNHLAFNTISDTDEERINKQYLQTLVSPPADKTPTSFIQVTVKYRSDTGQRVTHTAIVDPYHRLIIEANTVPDSL